MNIKKKEEIEPVRELLVPETDTELRAPRRTTFRELLAPVLGRNTFVKTEIKFKDKSKQTEWACLTFHHSGIV